MDLTCQELASTINILYFYILSEFTNLKAPCKGSAENTIIYNSVRMLSQKNDGQQTYLHRMHEKHQVTEMNQGHQLQNHVQKLE